MRAERRGMIPSILLAAPPDPRRSGITRPAVGREKILTPLKIYDPIFKPHSLKATEPKNPLDTDVEPVQLQATKEQAMDNDTLDPRDETHDSVDPATRTLTPAAVERRRTIIQELRDAGHEVATWAEALIHLSSAPSTPSPASPVPGVADGDGAEASAPASAPEPSFGA